MIYIDTQQQTIVEAKKTHSYTLNYWEEVKTHQTFEPTESILLPNYVYEGRPVIENFHASEMSTDFKIHQKSYPWVHVVCHDLLNILSHSR